jgi:hypothetical protein
MDKSVKLWIQSQNNLIEQLELQITNSTNVILMEKKILNHTKQTFRKCRFPSQQVTKQSRSSFKDV